MTGSLCQGSQPELFPAFADAPSPGTGRPSRWRPIDDPDPARASIFEQHGRFDQLAPPLYAIAGVNFCF